MTVWVQSGTFHHLCCIPLVRSKLQVWLLGTGILGASLKTACLWSLPGVAFLCLVSFQNLLRISPSVLSPCSWELLCSISSALFQDLVFGLSLVTIGIWSSLGRWSYPSTVIKALSNFLTVFSVSNCPSFRPDNLFPTSLLITKLTSILIILTDTIFHQQIGITVPILGVLT